MLFHVRNEGKGPRHIRNADGRSKLIQPGGVEKVDLLPEVAAMMHRLVALKADAKHPVSLVVEAIDAGGREALGAPPERTGNKRPEGTGALFIAEMPADAVEPAPRSPYVTPASSASAELLGRADTMSKEDLRLEAKLLLGKAAPKGIGRMSKVAIKELLRGG